MGGGPMMMEEKPEMMQKGGGKGAAKIAKADPIDTAIVKIRDYAVKKWGADGAKNVLARIDDLQKALKEYRENKVGSETPWNFGDAGLAKMVESTVNKYVKATEIKASRDGTEVSFKYTGKPPVKNLGDASKDD